MKITHTPTVMMKLIVSASFVLFIANCILVAHQYQVVNKFVSKSIYLNDKDDPNLEKLPVDFEQVAMTIEPNERFSLIDDKAWANTLAPKRGFIRLGPEGRSFAVGLYHQIHCVNALRFSYTVARDGLVTDPQVLRGKIDHDNHCFQFIRQSIQCKADTTLVPITQPNRNMSLAAMGFGNMHRCRNWADVRRFIVENQAQWDAIPLYNETSGRHVEFDT
ncbi:hypothetical protein BYT27DRAFT_7137331 [Phlegmacium glaucopus]|nr:hypothetical protein BYT27DRAFT_7137331 [Phlegmacium glaucopus]